MLGNFGISFFGPLGAINIGRDLFETAGGLDFYQTVIVAFISAMFVTGLSISREFADWGSEKNAKRK